MFYGNFELTSVKIQNAPYNHNNLNCLRIPDHPRRAQACTTNLTLEMSDVLTINGYVRDDTKDNWPSWDSR